MKDIIAIYSKLLISILSFIAPAITLLLNVFLGGVEKMKARNKEEILQIEGIIKMNVQNCNGDIEHTIKESLKLLKKQKSNAERQLRFLDPKRQIIRLFIPLISALVLLVVYILIKDYIKILNFTWVRIGCLLLSGLLCTYGLYVLYQLFCIIIETKRILSEDKMQDVLKPLVDESK
jgi:hypothetical protein